MKPNAKNLPLGGRNSRRNIQQSSELISLYTKSPPPTQNYPGGPDSEKNSAIQNKNKNKTNLSTSYEPLATFNPLHLSIATIKEDDYLAPPSIPEHNFVTRLKDKNVFQLKEQSLSKNKKIFILFFLLIVALLVAVISQTVSNETKNKVKVAEEETVGNPYEDTETNPNEEGEEDTNQEPTENTDQEEYEEPTEDTSEEEYEEPMEDTNEDVDGDTGEENNPDTNEDPEEETDENVGEDTDSNENRFAELLLGCRGDARELNLFRIAESITSNDIGTVVQLGNVELSCFPFNPLEKTDLDPNNIRQLILVNVKILILEENALNFNLVEFTIRDSFIEYFEVQSTNVDRFFVHSSNIVNYPRIFIAESIWLDDLVDFEFTERTIDFLTSFPKIAIAMISFLTDQLLLDFEQALSSSNKRIVFGGDQGSYLTLSGNTYTHLPGELFSASNFKLIGETGHWVFEEEYWSTTSPKLFLGQENAAQIGLNIYGCPELKLFPIAFSDLNVYYIEFLGSNLEEFEEKDFSVWENMYYISINPAPITEECRDLDTFRENHGIVDEVLIAC
eukprot:augustus_masked-scaffold_7-processed-gene-12.54-mRNA-1 protein AED:1.00 eAED:1.00 QI:0/-1/0/0/-1/1/1/0/561